MQVLKLICQTTVGLFKQACQLPHAVAVALKQRRRQFALSVLEAERLDRTPCAKSNCYPRTGIVVPEGCYPMALVLG